jgi:hypothetical protein
MLNKSQGMRIVDVFFLGPFMIWYALSSVDTMGPIAAWSLAFFGFMTILYNGYNWLGSRVLPELPF